MTETGGTIPPNGADRVGALSALYQAEQSALNSLDGQTLVLMSLLTTYGIAAVAALGAHRIDVDWIFLALPAPAWIILAYNAILWTKVANHKADAGAYQRELKSIAHGHDASAASGESARSRTEWRWWARTIFGRAGTRFFSYGVAFLLIVAFTVYLLVRGHRAPEIWVASIFYALGMVILAAAWVSIIYVNDVSDEKQTRATSAPESARNCAVQASCCCRRQGMNLPDRENSAPS
jgi:hypothetical protein